MKKLVSESMTNEELDEIKELAKTLIMTIPDDLSGTPHGAVALVFAFSAFAQALKIDEAAQHELLTNAQLCCRPLQN